MKTKLHRYSSMAAALTAVFILAVGVSAASSVTAQLEPREISVGESAQLTITVSGGSDEDVAAPSVPGLEFSEVGRSTQIRSINGDTTSTVSLTFEVMAQRPGKFTIPGLSRGAQPIVLQVRPGNARNGALARGNPSASTLPPPATNGLSSNAVQLTQDGSAFARLRLPKRELYVGETVPVEVQFGLRAGMVASLNGLPTLNGDAFTLNKLSPKPEQLDKMIGGKPFSLLTWHSALAAIKPGEYSLTVETPLTVRVRAASNRRAHFPKGFFDDSMFDDSMLDDSFFQSFAGGATEKEIVVASEPDALKIRALPLEGRPVGFSGAVGNFEVVSELSAEKTATGDPFTLRLKVTGTGSFDRVNSAMLTEGNGWKTYKPSSAFMPGDSAGYGGEKVFEQAVIPTSAGIQTIPPIAFSYFNPQLQKYETKRTAPLSITVSSAALRTPPPASIHTPTPANAVQVPPLTPDGMRPNHAEFGTPLATLRPLYFQAWFLALQCILIGAFIAASLLLNRHVRRSNDKQGARVRESSRAVTQCLTAMDAAAKSEDSHAFFQAARSGLQQRLAILWNSTPETITIAELDAHAGALVPDVRRIFALADESAYSGQGLTTADFQHWNQIVRQLFEKMEAA